MEAATPEEGEARRHSTTSLPPSSETLEAIPAHCQPWQRLGTDEASRGNISVYPPPCLFLPSSEQESCKNTLRKKTLPFDASANLCDLYPPVHAAHEVTSPPGWDGLRVSTAPIPRALATSAPRKGDFAGAPSPLLPWRRLYARP